MVEITGPRLIANTFIFGENHPFLVETFSQHVGWKVEVFGFSSVFPQYLSHLTSGRVHFCCVEIRITSRSVGCKKNFAPPILVRPYFFTFEILQDFSTELDTPYAIYCPSVFSDLL